jgi:hypothetical protein
MSSALSKWCKHLRATMGKYMAWTNTTTSSVCCATSPPARLDNALKSLAPHNESVVSAVVEALNDEVRLLAGEILRELGSKAEPALPDMIQALKDRDRIVRIASLEPVAAFGEEAKSAVPILEKWLSSVDDFSRVSAAGHIVMIDRSRTDDMMPVLLEALASKNTTIRRQAEWLLDELRG